jgi:hypothetical protein
MRVTSHASFTVRGLDMSPLRRLAVVALTGMVLAGCGGGMSSVTPGTGAQSASSGARAPRVAQPASPVLYVANVGEVDVYPLAATAGATPVRTIPAASGEIFAGVATAPNGNLAVLADYFDSSQNEYCKTLIYPPNADANTPTPAAHPCDPITTTQAEGIARGANGYDVLYRQAYNPSGSNYAVERLDGTGTITSTLVLPTGGAGWGSIATNSTGRDYVGRVGTVNKYDAGSTSSATAMKTFPLSSGYYPWAIAVSDTVYIANGHTGQLNGEVIDAYPAGATSPARTIGPFGHNYITAMAVDAQGLLYVALDPTSGYPALPRVRVYSATANGSDAPLRTITNAVPYGDIKGIAIYQP